MESGKYGLTCGTRFVASRPEVVVAVAGLLSISWCVLGGVGLLRVFFRFVFVERTRPATNMRHPCLIYLSTSNKARPKEQIEPRPVFAYRQKRPLHTGVRTGCHHFFSLSVCLRICQSVFVTFVFFLMARAVRGQFPQTRNLWKGASTG